MATRLETACKRLDPTSYDQKFRTDSGIRVKLYEREVGRVVSPATGHYLLAETSMKCNLQVHTAFRQLLVMHVLVLSPVEGVSTSAHRRAK